MTFRHRTEIPAVRRFEDDAGARAALVGVTRDVAKLRPGRVAYTVWCDDRGKVLDDGTLFRLSDSEFHLCSQERHLCWLLDSVAGFDVTVDDISEDVAALALQGPTSCAVLKRLGLAGVEMIKPFHIEHFPFEGDSLMVSRTGFTGDLGYELWIAPAMAEALQHRPWSSIASRARTRRSI